MPRGVGKFVFGPAHASFVLAFALAAGTVIVYLRGELASLDRADVDRGKEVAELKAQAALLLQTFLTCHRSD